MPPPSPTDSTSPSAGEFSPGDVLIGRYRIVGLLGEGGMGQVYLADDLTLDQQVAIKFLPERIAESEGGLERFRGEVRVARRVTHPNVARVHDIGEVDGRHFLTMAFVDGEDLSRLLKRIGRLPPEKAGDIAQQLCAGLAAAHEEGVLHRDLKPANVMLDGEGRVKITDFGLAILAEDQDAEAGVVGTPAYMSPEQFTGREVTERSEVYSLGLVLYELFTGRRAFEGKGVAELLRQQQHETPLTPSDILDDIDPAAEAVIMRCLEKDPAQRPSSVRAVALALPGGDPLAAALASGQTPAPELVAEAGESGGLSVAAVLAWAGTFLAGLLAIAAFSGKVRLVGVAPVENPPAVLEARAREILKGIGVDGTPADRLARFEYDLGLLEDLERGDDPLEGWALLNGGRPPAVRFLYRQSPAPLERQQLQSFFGVGFALADRRSDPPHTRPGMARVELDPGGELVALSVVPPQLAPESPVEEFDWDLLFEESGLDPAAFTPVPPLGHLGVETDRRLAWEGPYPGGALVARVEAGAFHGLPVHWQVQQSWEHPGAEGPAPDRSSIGVAIFLLLMVAMFSSAAAFARRNVRVKRADRRGAYRLALVSFLLAMLAWVLGEEHVASEGELKMFVAALSEAGFVGLFVWVFYLALEPTVRRLWPHRMTSWIRLFEGRLRDPLVGRDLLIGAALGTCLQLVTELEPLLSGSVGRALPSANPQELFTLLGGRHQLAVMAASLPGDGTFMLLLLILLVVLRLLLRRPALVVVAFLAVNLFMSLPSLNGPMTAVVVLAVYGLMLFAFLRFGLLVYLGSGAVRSLLEETPMTLDPSRWYIQNTALTLVVCTLVAALGFWVSLAGRPLLGEPTATTQPEHPEVTRRD